MSFSESTKTILRYTDNVVCLLFDFIEVRDTIEELITPKFHRIPVGNLDASSKT